MSRSATGSRAYFGGPPWWVVVAVPVGLVLALFVLEGVGVPTAPAVLGLFAALYAVFMMFGAFIVRVPAADWKPAGFDPASVKSKPMITTEKYSALP